MTTLNTLGLYDTSSVILQPKLAHNFRVRFLTPSGDPLPYSEHLSKQVTSTDPIPVWSKRRYDSEYGSIIGLEEFQIVLQDDLTDYAASSLLKLQEGPTFNVVIEYLDRDGTVVRTVTLTDCVVEKLVFDSLDYAGKSVVNTINTKYSCAKPRDASQSDMMNAFNNLTSSSAVYNNCVSDALSIFMTIVYNDVKFQFNNPNL